MRARPPMSRQWAPHGVAALLVAAFALVGCTDSGGGAPSGETAAARDDRVQVASSSEQTGAAVIADPDVSFSVLFEWTNLSTGDQGYFLWRQGSGMRRWDIVKFAGDEDAVGSLSIETDFSKDLAGGWPRLDCLWGRVESPPDHVRIGCGSGGALEFRPMDDALRSPISGRLKDQTITGRNASCYSFKHPQYGLAVLCVDQLEGIPLLLTTEHATDPRFSQSMEAVYISRADPGLVVPFGLEADPRDGYPDFDDTVPFSTLELLDFSGFKESALPTP